MLQYVIRRLLYSVVVLIVASMLVFTFVAKTGDPLAALRTEPEHLPAVGPEHQGPQAPRRLRSPVRYGYWVQGRRHQRFGTTHPRQTSRSCPTSGG